MGLSYLVPIVVMASLVVLPQGYAAPQSGLSLRDQRAVYYFKQILAYSFLFPGNLGDIWSDCSKPTDMMKIVGVEIKPDPPVKGQTLSVKGNITLKEDVTGGNVNLNISIDGVNVVDQQMDLCATIPQVNLMCPLKTGTHTLSISIDFPDDIPSGHVTGTQYLTDQNSKELACVKLDLKL